MTERSDLEVLMGAIEYGRQIEADSKRYPIAIVVVYIVLGMSFGATFMLVVRP